MNWWLHAVVDGESTRFPLSEDTLDVGGPAGAGLEFYEDSDHDWMAGGLGLSLHGDGPSFDLAVVDPATGSRLIVTDIDITMRTLCYIDVLDSVVVVEGDAGTTLSRNLLLVPLRELREHLAAGKGTVAATDLDLERVRGASSGIDLAIPGWSFVSPARTRELCGFANVPRVQPPVGQLLLVDFRGVQPGGYRTGVVPLIHGGIPLEGLWIADAVAGHLDDERLRTIVVGAVRKRREFLLGLRVITASSPDESLYIAKRDTGVVAHELANIELRDASAIKAVAMLPGARGCMVVTQDPYRGMHLYRIEVDEGGANATEIQLDGTPSDIRIVEESGAEAAGADEGSVDSNDKLVTVSPNGCSVALGQLAAEAWINVMVSIVGDGDGADLRWWLSQGEGEGDVDYTLHLSAARTVRVRHSVAGKP